MKKIIIALTGAALALTGAAVSAQAPQQGGGHMRPANQSEAIAHADQRFQMLDINRDGRLTQAELQAGKRKPGAKVGKHQRGGPDGKPGGQNRRPQFEQLDTNRDGVVTQSEFRAHAVERFANRGDRQR